MIKFAKKIKQTLFGIEYYPVRYLGVDITVERNSIADELEEIVHTYGGGPGRYTAYDDDILEVVNTLRKHTVKPHSVDRTSIVDFESADGGSNPPGATVIR